MTGYLIGGIITKSRGIYSTTDNDPGTILSGDVGNFFTNDENTNYTTAAPKAFLNYIAFDNQLNEVSANSGVVQVPTITGSEQAQPLVAPEQIIQKDGYLYIYVSNESAQRVFFDNLVIHHNRGPILQTDNYYPFGLTMAGISDEAYGAMESKRKFVGQELNHDEFSDGSGLDWYDFKFRKMDPQIGRFLQVDPLASKYSYNSPYTYAEDKPINGIDLEGLEWVNFLTSFEKPKNLYLKPPPTGNGVQIQSYSVTIHGSQKSFSDFYTTFKNEPQAILDNSKADFIPVNGEGQKLKEADLEKGSYLKADIAGPLNNSYVKVINAEKNKNQFSYTFGTLKGHIEQGAIRFSASQDKNGNIKFSIVSVSKTDELIPSLISHFTRNEQQKSWQEVLNNVAKYLEGSQINRTQTIINERDKNKEQN